MLIKMVLWSQAWQLLRMLSRANRHLTPSQRKYLMTLVPWKNKSGETPDGKVSPLVEFRSEVNRLFDTFLREPLGALGESFKEFGRWSPALDMAESDTEVTVRAEVPGVDPSEIDLTVTADRLTIAGEKKETTERTDRDVCHRETRYGSFSRTVQLPVSVDAANVQADYANGVLTVKLKKTPSAVVKKIPVKVNG